MESLLFDWIKTAIVFIQVILKKGFFTSVKVTIGFPRDRAIKKTKPTNHAKT